MFKRVLFVNGTVGVGKTTVAEQIAGLLAEAGEPHAWIDLDMLSTAWPTPSDDRFNTRLSIRNLECVATNMAAVGARSLILAGVVHRVDALDLYENALGIALTIVRLTSPVEIVEARLRGRYGDNDPAALQWHLDRAPELDGILDASPLAMHVVPNTGSAIDVARSVLAIWNASDEAT